MFSFSLLFFKSVTSLNLSGDIEINLGPGPRLSVFVTGA